MPEMWTDTYGDEYELLPIGTLVRYVPDLAQCDPETRAQHGATAQIVGYEDDEVTPYLIRIEADGDEFVTPPFWVEPAPGSGDSGA